MVAMWLEWLRVVLYGLVVLMLAGIAFVAGVFTAKKIEKPPLPAVVEQVPAENRAAAREAVERAFAARFAGEHDEALKQLQEARSLDATMRGLQYQIARTYLDLEDYEKADAAARRSIELEEETSNAQALRAMILFEHARAAGTVAQEGPEILARLNDSRFSDPLNPMPLYVMGEFYRANGQGGVGRFASELSGW